MRTRALTLLLALGLSPAPALASDENWTAPDAEKARPNPIARTEKDMSRGRSLYRQHCELCHGREGRGDGRRSGNGGQLGVHRAWDVGQPACEELRGHPRDRSVRRG